MYDEDSKLLPHAKPYSSDSAILKDNHPLSIMTACFQEDLLAHPLVTSLLRHKWQSYGRYVYYLNLFIYLIFLIFLTGYILTTDAPYKLKKDSGYRYLLSMRFVHFNLKALKYFYKIMETESVFFNLKSS